MHQSLDPDEARYELYRTMRSDACFLEKAERALEIGVEYLDVDKGHVARIDPASDYWEAIASTEPESGQFPVGRLLDLQRTFCRKTVQQDTSIAVHDALEQGWADDPAFESCSLRTYHGSTIAVDDDVFGTVCFVAEEPREPFRGHETLFGELVARMLEYELARDRYETAIDRRRELLNVLNRVLRHNLRNDMTVVRGRLELLAEAGVADTEPILDRIDDLLELSQKAREIESIFRREGDKQNFDLDLLLHSVVEAVAADYPAASFTVDAPEATITALPSIEVALSELVENAAKHTEDPTVTVSATATPADCRIQVADDGPGLSDNERAVIAEGVETPLVHGTGFGLWTVRWIVTSHGGGIEVTVDDGTTVTLSLPRTPADL